MKPPEFTDKERQTIRSMAIYWDEVAQRDGTSPLCNELAQIYAMVGPVRILASVALAANACKHDT
jgi:hypothetical protein